MQLPKLTAIRHILPAAPLKPVEAENCPAKCPDVPKIRHLSNEEYPHAADGCIVQKGESSTTFSDDARMKQGKGMLKSCPEGLQEDNITRGLVMVHLESAGVIFTSQSVASFSQEEDIERKFNIIIHKPDGTVMTRIAMLDTGCERDVVSEEVVEAVDGPTTPYGGFSLVAVGGQMINPIGQIRLDWNIAERPKIYTNNFWVLKSDDSTGFDGMLCGDTIRKMKFYKINHDVWCQWGNCSWFKQRRQCWQKGGGDHAQLLSECKGHPLETTTGGKMTAGRTASSDGKESSGRARGGNTSAADNERLSPVLRRYQCFHRSAWWMRSIKMSQVDQVPI